MEEFIGNNYNIPQLDLSERPENTPEKYAYLYEQTVVDDSESYLGHPDSVLLKNGDILTVYPHGHGKGAVLNKISADGGLSYTKCIAVPPESWKKSLETPTVYRLEFSDGTPDKLILVSANSMARYGHPRRLQLLRLLRRGRDMERVRDLLFKGRWLRFDTHSRHGVAYEAQGERQIR